MDKKTIEKFLNKKVKIQLKNSYGFSGKLLTVEDDHIVIDDWKNGEMALDLGSISTICEIDR